MKRLVGPALLAATAIAACAGPASAASKTYCNGALAANSFYRIIVRSEATPRVEYRGRFRFENTGASNRIMTATLVPIARVGNLNVIRPVVSFDLGDDEGKDITILSVRTNQGGTGAPNAQTVGGLTDFVCTYRPAS